VSAEPTLLFCIGAAKSGTTWLYNALLYHPECHLRGVKELHYFDALDAGSMAWQRKDNLKRLEGAHRRLVSDDLKTRRKAERDVVDREGWAKVQALPAEDDAAYLTYLTDGRTDQKVIGDLTPAYAMLSAERFAKMGQLLPDVRFLYLMRDPVARLWSHVRMVAGRVADIAPAYDDARQVLDETLDGTNEGIAARGDYKGTIIRLTSVIPAAKRLIMTFEEMMAGGMARICGFLGIAMRQGPPRVIHAGPKLDLLEDDRRRALAWLRPQYEFVTEFLGGLPAGWDPDGLGART
jgi:hypothetical protein